MCGLVRIFRYEMMHRNATLIADGTISTNRGMSVTNRFSSDRRCSFQVEGSLHHFSSHLECCSQKLNFNIQNFKLYKWRHVRLRFFSRFQHRTGSWKLNILFLSPRIVQSSPSIYQSKVPRSYSYNIYMFKLIRNLWMRTRRSLPLVTKPDSLDEFIQYCSFHLEMNCTTDVTTKKNNSGRMRHKISCNFPTMTSLTFEPLFH